MLQAGLVWRPFLIKTVLTVVTGLLSHDWSYSHLSTVINLMLLESGKDGKIGIQIKFCLRAGFTLVVSLSSQLKSLSLLLTTVHVAELVWQFIIIPPYLNFKSVGVWGLNSFASPVLLSVLSSISVMTMRLVSLMLNNSVSLVTALWLT